MMKVITKGVNIAIFLGIILISALLAKDYLLTRYAIPVRDESHAAKGPSLLHPPGRRFSDYAVITENGIFGIKGRLTSIIDLSAGGRDTRGVQSKMDGMPPDAAITLLGTVLSQEGMNYAVIEEKRTKRQELFREGSRVFNRGILKDIEKDSISIIRGGREYTLYIPLDKQDIYNHQAGIKPNKGNEGKTSFSQKRGEREWVVDRRALDRTLSNMGKVLTDARLLPYSKGDTVIGFRLSEVKQDGIFGVIGLKNGDILLRVNDYTIDSPEKGMQLIAGLKGESVITLDLIRNGKALKLRYYIR